MSPLIMKILALVLSLVIADVEHVAALVLTHYGIGVPGDQPGGVTFDPNSANGVGAFGFDTQPHALDHMLSGGLQPVALSPDVVAQYNLQPGQEFSITTSGGQTFSNLVFADKTSDALTGRIDFYDPQNTFSLSGAQVATLNGGPVLAAADLAGAGGAPGDLQNIQNVNAPNVIQNALSKFQHAGEKWTGVMQKGATSLFWILAGIALVWSGMELVLKVGGSTLQEWAWMVVRFIMGTGFFFWLLTNGPGFALAIINSLWQLGGQAGGGGNSILPSQLYELSMKIFQGIMNHLHWWEVEASIAPILLGLGDPHLLRPGRREHGAHAGRCLGGCLRRADLSGVRRTEFHSRYGYRIFPDCSGYRRRAHDAPTHRGDWYWIHDGSAYGGW